MIELLHRYSAFGLLLIFVLASKVMTLYQFNDCQTVRTDLHAQAYFSAWYAVAFEKRRHELLSFLVVGMGS